ncbi:MAG: bifunctional phosphopantothenoylcysteine decarboxylase/phosphopantothenate--cysteine ligase CoaBC [Desulfovibrionales bacterium]
MQPHCCFSLYRNRRVHLGITGSIAACKSLELLRMLGSLGLRTGMTLTKGAQQFLTPLTCRALGADPVHTAMFDAPGHDFAHLEPGQQAEAMLVAPATANIIAKAAHGIADDLLSCQLLAFPGPLLMAPAMNHRMWSAIPTQENWARLKDRSTICLDPAEGPMACGESGVGRMAGLDLILMHLLRALTDQDLKGRRILLTLGPTRERWDPVRFWSNPSSGIMGGSLAVAAWLRGAEVGVVHGPVDLWFPPGITCYPVTTAAEMFTACTDLWPGMDMGCLTAAVCDFSPVPHGTEKFKKSRLQGSTLTVEFTANADILAELGRTKSDRQMLIGFAAETSDLEANARRKLTDKNLDLIVANTIGVPGRGFGSPSNEVLVLDRNGGSELWPLLPKPEIAWRIWDRILPLAS